MREATECVVAGATWEWDSALHGEPQEARSTWRVHGEHVAVPRLNLKDSNLPQEGPGP